MHNGLKFRGAIIAQKPVFTIQNGKKIIHLPLPLKIKYFKRGKGLTKETLGETFEGTRKTLRLLVSKAATLYDPTGINFALTGQLRYIVRQACLHSMNKKYHIRFGYISYIAFMKLL